MKRPELWEIVFSLKAFIAALLALYIAFWLDLPRPYWAMTTAYVVSQPFAASSLSKGIFRFSGTIIGASVAILMVALFGADDVATLIGLTAWFCFCGYFALLDRTPRSYFFLLAGMTAVLVGWPGAAGGVFDTGTARVQEIGLGILSTVLVHSLIFPRNIIPAVSGILDKWATDAKRLILDTLSGSETGRVDRQQLASDAGPLSMLVVHLRYDTPERREAARWVDVLRERMLLLLPVTASIESRLAVLRRSGEPLAHVDALLGEIRAWFDDGMPKAAIADLKREMDAVEPEPSGKSSGATIELVGLIERLRAVVLLAGQCRDLSDQVNSPSAAPSPRLRALERQTRITPHQDRGMVIMSIAGAVLAMMVSATFWYLTGWPQGGGAAEISLLMCLFLGAADDPRPLLKQMIIVLLFSIVLDTFYMYVLIPRIQDYWVLALALAPALLPLGMMGANPATIMIGLMPIAMMTLTETASTDSATFINGMVATIFGVVIALVVVGLVRRIGTEISVRRILDAGWRDLEIIAAGRGPEDRLAFSSRMLDRLGLLAPRLQALPGNSALLAVDAMADLRLGLHLMELRRYQTTLGDGAARRIADLFTSLSQYFRSLHRRGLSTPPADMLDRVDETIGIVAGTGGLHARRQALLALTGIRHSLFPSAPPYQGPAEAADDQIAVRLAAE